MWFLCFILVELGGEHVGAWFMTTYVHVLWYSMAVWTIYLYLRFYTSPVFASFHIRNLLLKILLPLCRLIFSPLVPIIFLSI